MEDRRAQFVVVRMMRLGHRKSFALVKEDISLYAYVGAWTK